MSVKSIKHTDSKRAHIPSREEAGFEDANPKVQQGDGKSEYPKNPVVHRGQDPELFWMHKYGEDDSEDRLSVDIRSLYRHEHIAPEALIQNFYRLKEQEPDQLDMFSTNELFGNALEMDEIEKISEYYSHQDGWSNRLIQGDSLLVMNSLLEREGMAGQVQCIYIDPPYGIKYGGNWQMKLNDKTVTDGKDEHLCGEPEQVKAYRDTWELGIHSYLSYLRDRLLTSKELLTESGSCFVQISDDNVHLVRCLMDEVFGSENFISQLAFYKTSSQSAGRIASVVDYILVYAKDATVVKYRPLLAEKSPGEKGAKQYKHIISPDFKQFRKMTEAERIGAKHLPPGWKVFRFGPTTSQGRSKTRSGAYLFEGDKFYPSAERHWSYDPEKEKEMDKLVEKGRIKKTGKGLSTVLLMDDNPTTELDNIWADTGTGSFTEDQRYVVQTGLKVIQRCILMATDPGDLVLDPTCGSGTTAYVAEQWGRRWITTDTSRIALNIAKTRLMTATLPYYKLYDQQGEDIRQGFIYKTLPHITLKSLANEEPFETETLYDQPEEDKKKLRVCGPFTVETLQNFEPVSPDELDAVTVDSEDLQNFEERIFEHLKSAGVKNGIKNEHAVFVRVDRLNHSWLHAEGFYMAEGGDGSPSGPQSGRDGSPSRPQVEKKAYFHIGPKFGTVSKQAVNEAMKECRTRGDADWLIVLGFSFESTVTNQNVTMSAGSFEVTKVRMHDDLMQDGLLKKDKKAASFVTIGEPDIAVHELKEKSDDGHKQVQLEILGLDIYDPIKDIVNARNAADIAYWMVDTDYDGSNFIVRQVFFCGGNKDEFKKWKKGLESLAKTSAKRAAEKTLKIEIDDDAFDRVYNHHSHPIPITKDGHKIAVRVISQFGEESTKVIEV
ncbi:MAG: site-specific DNA-methyltransferase [Desulfobacteraceae bacterium]|jgi:adenine-specific DNA-methyltransferase|nr:site-specific DNA-methyltransferase [Desulfobacteraceae bacterium]